jgi:hypothetical protein
MDTWTVTFVVSVEGDFESEDDAIEAAISEMGGEIDGSFASAERND